MRDTHYGVISIEDVYLLLWWAVHCTTVSHFLFCNRLQLCQALWWAFSIAFCLECVKTISTPSLLDLLMSWSTLLCRWTCCHISVLGSSRFQGLKGRRFTCRFLKWGIFVTAPECMHTMPDQRWWFLNNRPVQHLSVLYMNNTKCLHPKRIHKMQRRCILRFPEA